jgi:uncharacterized Zn finger protein (UPF0148 family)
MITCPVCGQSQLLGSVFCQNCGSQFDIKKNNGTNQENLKFDTKSPPKDLTSSVKMTTWISLYNLDNGENTPLPNIDEIIIGRISEDQGVLPDFDLTRFKALENGVSRLHCALKRNKSQTIISDLGSSNGTYLNGSRLPENQETPIRHGDILMLGRLKFQILLH